MFQFKLVCLRPFLSPIRKRQHLHQPMKFGRCDWPINRIHLLKPCWNPWLFVVKSLPLNRNETFYNPESLKKQLIKHHGSLEKLMKIHKKYHIWHSISNLSLPVLPAGCEALTSISNMSATLPHHPPLACLHSRGCDLFLPDLEQWLSYFHCGEPTMSITAHHYLYYPH